MLKIEKMVQVARELEKTPYIFGTSGQECTPAKRRERASSKKAYAENIHKYCPVLSGKQSSCDGCKWEGMLAFDCRGLTLYVCKKAGMKINSIGATSQWNADDWIVKGTIDEMPMDKPCILFHRKNGSNTVMSHTGIYCGDGWAIDCRGHASGTVKKKVSSYPWTHYAVPKGAYDEFTDYTQPSVSGQIERHTIRKGAKGAAVIVAQAALIRAGYDCGKKGADGIFGEATAAAVKAFQKDHSLAVDGVIGKLTWAKLDEVAPTPEDENTPEISTPEIVPTVYTVTLYRVSESELGELREKYPDLHAEVTIG